jgi:hypothetical protein
MKFETRKPGLQVTLIKNIKRTTLNGTTPVSSRYTGQTPVVDLTPYIGEANSVRVSKSVREPAGGFSITLTEQLFYNGDASYGDSLYGLIEPMDSIEIRMAANAYKSSTPPTMMRGFVSSIGKSDTMGADGRPQRTIFVSGQDYGKILQMMQVFYMPGTSDDASYISTFPFFTKFGIDAKPMLAIEFYQTVFDQVITPYIINMGGGQNGLAPLLTIETDFITQTAQVSPTGAGGYKDGTVYNLLREYGDIGTFNEFFIEDREDAPYAVYRPNPFNDVNGIPIFTFPSGKFPAYTKISAADVVAVSGARTDANVANYFWVDSPPFNLNDVVGLRQQSIQSAQDGIKHYVTDYANVDPTLYGSRKMWERTMQSSPWSIAQGNGLQNTPFLKEQTNATSWITQRRVDLYNQNKDNILFESGSFRLKGNETIRAGTYLQYANGDMLSEYYVVSVEHDYAPFGSYFTTVQYERGTGFINRIQRNAGRDSPYLAELASEL